MFDQITDALSVVDEPCYDDTTKRRLKTPRRSIDWPAMVNAIIADTGASVDELSEKTGLSASFLASLRRDGEFVNGDKAINLLALFFLNTGRDLPLVGQYHEGL